jgi:MFS transporter, DHA2 family, multidrug resistance protein
MGYIGSGIELQREEARGWRLNQALIDLSQRHKVIILLSIGLVAGVELANRVSINVLLPDLQGNVAGNSDDVSWVLILYNLGFLTSIALSYWFTRVFGARRNLLISIALYAAGAIGCFLSEHSLTLLLISRVVMGFGGGAFLVRAVIFAGLMFPGKARFRAVFWIFTEATALQAVYPVAMGWISDAAHWNYAFLLDFPFLAISAILIWKYVPRGFLRENIDRSRVDLWGAGLLVAALACMQIGLSRGERDEWFQSSFITCFLIVALVCFLAFLWWDWRPENTSPVLNLQVAWREVPLRTSLGIVMIVGAMLGAGLFVLPQYLRTVQDYSATQTGGFVSAYTAGLGTGVVLSLGYGVARLGGTRLVVIGALIMCTASVIFIYIWTPTTPTWVLVLATYLQGSALGPLLSGASNIATSRAALIDLNDVSTSYYFVRQLGNTFGVTAATVIFDRRQTLHSARLVDVANALDPTTQATLSQYAGLIAHNGGAGSNPALGAVQLLQSGMITQSRLLAYIDIYFGLGVLAFAILCLLFLARTKSASPQSQHHFHLW